MEKDKLWKIVEQLGKTADFPKAADEATQQFVDDLVGIADVWAKKMYQSYGPVVYWLAAGALANAAWCALFPAARASTKPREVVKSFNRLVTDHQRSADEMVKELEK